MRLTTYFKSKKIIPILFIIPTIIVVLGVTIFPFLYVIRLSFFRLRFQLPGQPFVGIQNYLSVFQDTRYGMSILQTLIILTTAVSAELAIGFGLAHLCVDEFPGKQAILTAMLLPVMIIPVVCGYMWRLLWSTQFGPINHIISIILQKEFVYNWLAHTNTAFLCIIITEIWEWTPFMFLVCLAGLSALPAQVYEAAAIDGVSTWKRFTRITLPLIWPVLSAGLIFRSLDCFRIFDIVVALTQGGPGTGTETASLYLYQIGFKHFNLGYTAAATIVLLVLLGTFSIFLMKRQHTMG